MSQLSNQGQELVQQIAQRYGLSNDAVTHMLYAVSRGNGSMAQFSHPEFGGSGQWMQGGMTMVSDLFNNHLKNLVNNLCSELANALANNQQSPFSGSFQSQSQNGSSNQSQAAGAIGSVNSLFRPDPESNWWPQNLGSPNAIGSQNNVAYAYFSSSRRLAVKTGNQIWVYDTLDHQIGGFSQQQGSFGTISFSSQFGTVSLSNLPVVSINGVEQTLQRPSAPPAPMSQSPSYSVETVQSNGPTSNLSTEDVLGTLQRLGELAEKGYISQDEFASKKADLLSRL